MEAIILLGAPGAGKGTAAERLVKRLGVRHVSSGDLLRSAVKQGTPAGREADGYMKQGKLVPDELIGRIIADLLVAGGPDLQVLLDGFPRTVAQAEMLEKVIAASSDKKISREEVENITGAPRAGLVNSFIEALIAKNWRTRHVIPGSRTSRFLPSSASAKDCRQKTSPYF